MNLADIGDGGWWLVAALALGIAELVVPGVFLVFLAIARGDYRRDRAGGAGSGAGRRIGRLRGVERGRGR